MPGEVDEHVELLALLVVCQQAMQGQKREGLGH